MPQNPYTFGGNGVRDRTTDWVHYGARYYNPRTGTFTQQDTLDAPLDPLNANRYAYAGGDPINYVDPTGESAACAGAIAGLGATVAADAAGFGILLFNPITGVAAAGFAAGTIATLAAGAYFSDVYYEEC